MLQHSGSFPVDDDDAEFSDALDEFTFFDAYDSEHSLSVSNSSSVYDSNHGSVSKLPDTPEPQSSPSSAGLRRRRIFRRQNSKELGFKNSSDSSADFELHGSNPFPAKSYKFSWNLKDNHKLNDKLKHPRVRVSSGSVGKRLTEETNVNSLNSTGIVTLTDDGSISDRSVTVDSPITGSNFVFTLARLIVKVISLQTTLLVAFVSFPIWLTHSSYMFVTDPLAIIRRAKRYMIRSISRLLNFCLINVKRIVYILIKRNKSVWKLCLQMGWGLLWAVFVGFVLVGLFIFAFVIGAAMMKWVVEVPVHKIEQLNFDYTRNSPMAFVPMSCPEPSSLECNEKIEFENLAPLRFIPPDRKLQATILLTLPESDYNKNLGNFQVRVDFLSSNGKSLASATQPCTMQFKSWPIRLLMTVFKLAPLITGYSSESQTLHIKFDGYTEREIPTCGARVVLEPRAEFAKGGGVPEIYTAYLKLESQLPLLQRILWSWKVTVFVWTSIMIFTMGSVFIMLCCIPVFVPGLQPRRVPLNNTGSR
ncbi:hypothetical protein L1987_60535 [Smallanthus sonchifolius]|uniref:Uncharacterized protein n=1 Tax=Smallanthus sonchifolius TaxID=185202 RepID=A0ACB9D8A1_9ASTR|nr:hypothetical protein L1987_60535 [Smallanthus sonchifolius]